MPSRTPATTRIRRCLLTESRIDSGDSSSIGASRPATSFWPGWFAIPYSPLYPRVRTGYDRVCLRLDSPNSPIPAKGSDWAVSPWPFARGPWQFLLRRGCYLQRRLLSRNPGDRLEPLGQRFKIIFIELSEPLEEDLTP